MSLLPRLFTPGDITTLQTSLNGGVKETDLAVQACGNLDAPTKASWGFFRDSVLTYCAVPVTGIGPALAKDILLPWGALIRSNTFGNSTDEFYNTGRAYEQQLVEWQAKLESVGCKVAAGYHPAKDPQESDAEKILRWGAIGAAVVGGAYLISLAAPAIVEGVAAWRATRKAKST